MRAALRAASPVATGIGQIDQCDRAKRSAVEEHIQALIDLLDRLDEDPDLEPDNDDEATLGWPERTGRFETGSTCRDGEIEDPLGWGNGVWQLDLGMGTEDGDTTAPERAGRGFVRCASDDHEPSLGSGNPDWTISGGVSAYGYRRVDYIDQRFWSAGNRDDRELDAGDEPEPDADEEHWRQAPEGFNRPSASTARPSPPASSVRASERTEGAQAAAPRRSPIGAGARRAHPATDTVATSNVSPATSLTCDPAHRGRMHTPQDRPHVNVHRSDICPT